MKTEPLFIVSSFNIAKKIKKYFLILIEIDFLSLTH